METITAKEFLKEMFNIDWMSSEEIETIEKAMILFAKGKCKEQRTLCAQEIQRINPKILNHPQDVSGAMIVCPEPKY